ncbi:MAG: S-layer homology domain-containing protein [Bacillota bacterium]|uniref:S-layer homology domain-containing protein n=1 Tax=Desulforudis sp. DRI-14 TaxID=3459793 RepID=UPI0034710C02
MAGRKRIWMALTVMVLALSCLAAGQARAEELATFQDVRGHWAEETIMQVRALDLMNGYPGNVFKPKDNVTRREALVVIIRALGLENEASRIDTSKIVFPPDIKWGQGYIALAAQKQLFSGQISQIKFNEPATRLEIALWLAKALNLQTDDTPLVFTDTANIPAAYQRMLAAVYREGIMSGTSATLFEPQRPVTRAEVASLLGKMLGTAHINPYPGRFITGQLVAVDWQGGKITLRTSSGAFTYPLKQDHIVYRGGQKVTLSSMSLEQNVKLILNGSGQVIFVGKSTGQTPAAQTSEYDGKILAVVSASNQLFFQTSTGGMLTLNISPSVSVTRNGVSLRLSDVTVGAEARIRVTGNQVQAVELKAEALEGAVIYIRTSGTKRIMIEKSNGQEETYYLADSVTVKEGSATRSLGYIEEGMQVKLTLNSDDKVTRIEITAPAGIQGTVTYIRTSGTKRIMIEKSNGDEETYYLAETVTVKEGSATRSLGYIEEGMLVELTLNSDDKVTRIEISGRAYVSGDVTYIRTSGTKRIMIEKSNGDEETYYLAETVTVKEGSATRSLGHIEVGMTVKLTLNTDEQVSRIDIL